MVPVQGVVVVRAVHVIVCRGAEWVRAWVVRPSRWVQLEEGLPAYPDDPDDLGYLGTWWPSCGVLACPPSRLFS